MDDDVLRKLLGYLPTDSLLRAGAVCRRWRRLVHDPARPLWRETFAKTWGLADVSGAPKSLAFCATERPQSFVQEYQLERGDTVAAIAVRHGMSLGEVKRANGLLSEHALNLRTKYLVPVRDASRLVGARAHIHVDAASNREVVLVLGNDPLRDEFVRRAPAPMDPVRAARLSAAMVEALAKTIGQDVDTARYYMEQARGDMRGAHAAFTSDKEWSERNPVASAAARRSGRRGGGGGGSGGKGGAGSGAGSGGGSGGGGGGGGVRPHTGRGMFFGQVR